MLRITPSLGFDTESDEAAVHYVSIIPNSRITAATHSTESSARPAGMVLPVEFALDGQRFIAINGGPQFPFSEVVPLMVECADQTELDQYWERPAEGGAEGPCGWLKDRCGLSWRVCPTGMEQPLNDPDPARARPAMAAILGMRRIDIAALHAAGDAEER